MKEYDKRLVEEVNLTLSPGEWMVIRLNSELGIDTIRITSGKQETEVSADSSGGSRFYLEKRKVKSDAAKYSLTNQNIKNLLKDYLQQKFWGQFNFGELIELHENKGFKKRLSKAIDKVIEKFDGIAADDLNALPGIPKRVRRKK